MPSRDEVLTFLDPPEGADPWVEGARPDTDVVIVEYDGAWVAAFDEVAQLVRSALPGADVEHVGSTSVPGLPAKPVVDVDLVVPDPDDEQAYVPALGAVGFVLRIREPWWYRHRMLRHDSPRCNLHVFGPESPEPVRHRLFRDWLRSSAADRDLYAEAKRAAAAGAGDVMAYNARKEPVVRDIYRRAFSLLEH